MDDENVSPYDLMTVIVVGHELSARPTQFKTDDDGNVLYATHYETVCPYCGNLIAFPLDQLRQDRKLGCLECKRGFDHIVHNPIISNVDIKKTGQRIEMEAPRQINDECPFLDPIESGVFNIKGYLEIR